MNKSEVAKISNQEIEKILSLQQVHSKLLCAMLAQKDERQGFKQPSDVLRNQCDKCHYYAVDCIKGSEYEAFSVFNRNCARFSPFDLDSQDSLI